MQTRSKHAIRDLPFYLENTRRGVIPFFGNPSEFVWLVLLPGYGGNYVSSLIEMMRHFIGLSRYQHSGFFLHDQDDLAQILRVCERDSLPTILFGVSHALLDFSASYPMPLRSTKIVETGGMKGRREEMTKQDLHDLLISRFSVPVICSEYGMTELSSQAWSTGEGIFHPASTLKILIRDITDPAQYLEPGRRGAINCLDLANVDSCCFIATDDVGIAHSDGSFEVLGRIDASDLRGCNLLVSDL